MGEDVGSAVDFTYQPPSRFTGTIAKATIDLKGGATAAAPGAAMMGCRERLRGKRQLWGQGWRSRTVARAPSLGQAASYQQILRPLPGFCLQMAT